MKDWIVETRVVSRRIYFVQAEDEKEAIFASTHVPPECDEDEYEETMSVVENLAGVAEQSGAGAPETSVRCGAPAAQCEDCPPVEYPTDVTRCEQCPRRCDHDWHVWPETDGQVQHCLKCKANRKTVLDIEECGNHSAGSPS